MSDRPYNQIIKLFYLYSVFSSVNFFIPYEILYFRKSGFSTGEIFWIHTLFSAFIVLFEIPSGYMADRWGRKTVLSMAPLAAGTGFFVILLTKNFWGYLVGYLFFSLTISFVSGADTAFLYDTLRRFGCENEFQKIAGKKNAYVFYTSAFCGIISALLAKVNLRLTLIFTAFFSLGAFFISRCLPTDGVEKLCKEKVKKRKLYQLHNELKNIHVLILCASIFYTSTLIVVKITQIVIFDLKIPTETAGIFWTSSVLLTGFSSNFVGVIRKRWCNIKSTLFLIFITPILVFVSMSILPLNPYILIMFLIIPTVKNFGTIIIDAEINKKIGSVNRATVNSMSNFVFRMMYMIILPVFGFFVDAIGLQGASGLLALFFILLYAGFLLKMIIGFRQVG